MTTPKDQPVDEQTGYDNFVLRYTRDGVWVETRGMAAIIYILENNWQFNDYIQAECNRARLSELESLHRKEGDGLPDRDYDNVTDELIDERIAELQQLMKGRE